MSGCRRMKEQGTKSDNIQLASHFSLSCGTTLSYSTDQMQLNPRMHASFESLVSEVRVVHSLNTPTCSSPRHAQDRTASAALCLALILLKELNAA